MFCVIRFMHYWDVFETAFANVFNNAGKLGGKRMKKNLIDLLKKNRKQKGFTLIEMVIVIAIVVMLLVIIAPNLVQQKQRAQTKTDEAFRTTLQTQVELYNDEHPSKKLTSSLEDLATAKDSQGDSYLSEDQKKKLSKYRLENGKVVLINEKK